VFAAVQYANVFAEKVRQRAFTVSGRAKRWGEQESFSQAVENKQFWGGSLFAGMFDYRSFDIRGKANVHEFFLSVQIYQPSRGFAMPSFPTPNHPVSTRRETESF
jgi:hypothetical protein